MAQNPTTLYTFLATNGTAGGTVWPVKNIAGLNNNWAQQIGKTGEETAEIVNISGAPSGTVFNSSGTAKFAHSLDTPIYQIHYDQIVISRSTSGTAGTATPLATVSITPDSFYTNYDDTSGSATYAYQTQFYNSVSGDLSATSDWFVPGGPTFYSFQKLKGRVKHDLYSAQYIKDDATIGDWVNEWIEQMTNSALKVNEAYSIGTASYAFGTAGLGTITAPLFKYAAKIEVTFDGVTYTPTTKIPLNQFSDFDIFSSFAPRHYWQGDTVFGVLPVSAGTARMSLGQLSTQLDSDSDELPQYLKSYTAGCIEYCLYKAKSLDQKDAAAEENYLKYIKNRSDFIAEITPRDFTGPSYIGFVEGLSGREEDLLISDEVFW